MRADENLDRLSCGMDVSNPSTTHIAIFAVKSGTTLFKFQPQRGLQASNCHSIINIVGLRRIRTRSTGSASSSGSERTPASII